MRVLVHVKKGNVLDQFFTHFAGNCRNIAKFNRIFNNQRQISTGRWEFADFLIGHILFSQAFQQFIPLKNGRINFVAHAQFFDHLATDPPKSSQNLLAAVVSQAVGKTLVVFQHRFLVTFVTEARKDVLHVALEREIRRFVAGPFKWRLHQPGFAIPITAQEQAELRFFINGPFAFEAVHLAKFEQTQTGLLAVLVVHDGFQTADQHVRAHDVQLRVGGIVDVHQFLVGNTFEGLAIITRL